MGIPFQLQLMLKLYLQQYRITPKCLLKKIKKSLTSLRKRNSPTTSSLRTSRSTSELDCRNLESSNDDPDRMKYLIFMFTISLFFWGRFFEHVTKKIKNTRTALKQKSD